MRFAGFNAGGINTEPINGQGIYQAGRSLFASWNVPAPTLPASRTLAISWDDRGAAIRQLSLSWSCRVFVARTIPVSWHMTGGVCRLGRFAWRLPLAFHKSGISPIDHKAVSDLTRHTSTTSPTWY